MVIGVSCLFECESAIYLGVWYNFRTCRTTRAGPKVRKQNGTQKLLPSSFGDEEAMVSIVHHHRCLPSYCSGISKSKSSSSTKAMASDKMSVTLLLML